jgi:hypothetical protein
LNGLTFWLDGVPAGLPAYQAGGWIEERLASDDWVS